jgi:ribosomal-protein-alanine acetyltransferase
MPVIRRGAASDLDAVAVIQARCPEAAQWDVTGYLQYHLLVAVREGQVEGFLVSRLAGEDECEILNLGVDPEFRRRGLARGLVGTLVSGFRGGVYLEVRESNQAARNLYNSMGFQEVSCRQGYYDTPPEAAIVMKFHSC